jgi:hypothetical protein
MKCISLPAEVNIFINIFDAFFHESNLDYWKKEHSWLKYFMERSVAKNF